MHFWANVFVEKEGRRDHGNQENKILIEVLATVF